MRLRGAELSIPLQSKADSCYNNQAKAQRFPCGSRSIKEGSMKKYILAFAIALGLALIVWIPNGLFAMPGTKEMYRILSDGLFLSGGVLAGFGVLGLIAGKSQHIGALAGAQRPHRGNHHRE